MNTLFFVTCLLGLNSIENSSAQEPEIIGGFTGAPNVHLIRDAGHKISLDVLGSKHHDLGVISTQGVSDFHVIFKPGKGFSIYGIGKVNGFTAPESEKKIPFEKGIFFHGAGFPLDSGVSLDLTEPGNVVSFDKIHTGGNVGFKVLEFELGPALADHENRYFRVLVTEFADILPLSMSATSMKSWLPGDTESTGPNAFNAEEYLRKNFFKISNVKPSGAFTFAQTGSHPATVGMTNEEISLRKCSDFDARAPWEDLKQKTGNRLTKWSIFSDFYAKAIPGNSFEKQFSEADPNAYQALTRSREPFAVEHSPLKVIRNVALDARWTEHTDFSNSLRTELDYSQIRTRLSPGNIHSPRVRFPLDQQNRAEFNYFFSRYASGSNAYFVDLDEEHSGEEMFEDLQNLRKANEPFLLITLSHGIAEATYLNPGSEQSLGALLRRDAPHECELLLSGALAGSLGFRN